MAFLSYKPTYMRRMFCARVWIKIFVATAFVFQSDSVSKVLWITIPYAVLLMYTIWVRPFRLSRPFLGFVITTAALIIVTVAKQ